MTKGFREASGWLFLALLGVVIVSTSLLADSLGLGLDGGLGRTQITGLVGGSVMLAAGLFLWKRRTGAAWRGLLWRTLAVIAVAVPSLLAFAVVAFGRWWSVIPEGWVCEEDGAVLVCQVPGDWARAPGDEFDSGQVATCERITGGLDCHVESPDGACHVVIGGDASFDCVGRAP